MTRWRIKILSLCFLVLSMCLSTSVAWGDDPEPNPSPPSNSTNPDPASVSETGHRGKTPPPADPAGATDPTPSGSGDETKRTEDWKKWEKWVDDEVASKDQERLKALKKRADEIKQEYPEAAEHIYAALKVAGYTDEGDTSPENPAEKKPETPPAEKSSPEKPGPPGLTKAQETTLDTAPKKPPGRTVVGSLADLNQSTYKDLDFRDSYTAAVEKGDYLLAEQIAIRAHNYDNSWSYTNEDEVVSNGESTTESQKVWLEKLKQVRARIEAKPFSEIDGIALDGPNQEYTIQRFNRLLENARETGDQKDYEIAQRYLGFIFNGGDNYNGAKSDFSQTTDLTPIQRQALSYKRALDREISEIRNGSPPRKSPPPIPKAIVDIVKEDPDYRRFVGEQVAARLTQPQRLEQALRVSQDTTRPIEERRGAALAVLAHQGKEAFARYKELGIDENLIPLFLGQSQMPNPQTRPSKTPPGEQSFQNLFDLAANLGRTEEQIVSLLTPEQRQSVQKFQEIYKERFGQVLPKEFIPRLAQLKGPEIAQMAVLLTSPILRPAPGADPKEDGFRSVFQGALLPEQERTLGQRLNGLFASQLPGHQGVINQTTGPLAQIHQAMQTGDLQSAGKAFDEFIKTPEGQAWLMSQSAEDRNAHEEAIKSGDYQKAQEIFESFPNSEAYAQVAIEARRKQLDPSSAFNDAVSSRLHELASNYRGNQEGFNRAFENLPNDRELLELSRRLGLSEPGRQIAEALRVRQAAIEVALGLGRSGGGATEGDFNAHQAAQKALAEAYKAHQAAVDRYGARSQEQLAFEERKRNLELLRDGKMSQIPPEQLAPLLAESGFLQWAYDNKLSLGVGAVLPGPAGTLVGAGLANSPSGTMNEQLKALKAFQLSGAVGDFQRKWSQAQTDEQREQAYNEFFRAQAIPPEIVQNLKDGRYLKTDTGSTVDEQLKYVQRRLDELQPNDTKLRQEVESTRLALERAREAEKRADPDLKIKAARDAIAREQATKLGVSPEQVIALLDREMEAAGIERDYLLTRFSAGTSDPKFNAAMEQLYQVYGVRDRVVDRLTPIMGRKNAEMRIGEAEITLKEARKPADEAMQKGFAKLATEDGVTWDGQQFRFSQNIRDGSVFDRINQVSYDAGLGQIGSLLVGQLSQLQASGVKYHELTGGQVVQLTTPTKENPTGVVFLDAAAAAKVRSDASAHMQTVHDQQELRRELLRKQEYSWFSSTYQDRLQEIDTAISKNLNDLHSYGGVEGTIRYKSGQEFQKMDSSAAEYLWGAWRSHGTVGLDDVTAIRGYREERKWAVAQAAGTTVAVAGVVLTTPLHGGFGYLGLGALSGAAGTTSAYAAGTIFMASATFLGASGAYLADWAMSPEGTPYKYSAQFQGAAQAALMAAGTQVLTPIINPAIGGAINKLGIFGSASKFVAEKAVSPFVAATGTTVVTKAASGNWENTPRDIVKAALYRWIPPHTKNLVLSFLSNFGQTLGIEVLTATATPLLFGGEAVTYSRTGEKLNIGLGRGFKIYDFFRLAADAVSDAVMSGVQVANSRSQRNLAISHLKGLQEGGGTPPSRPPSLGRNQEGAVTEALRANPDLLIDALRTNPALVGDPSIRGVLPRLSRDWLDRVSGALPSGATESRSLVTAIETARAIEEAGTPRGLLQGLFTAPTQISDGGAVPLDSRARLALAHMDQGGDSRQTSVVGRMRAQGIPELAAQEGFKAAEQIIRTSDEIRQATRNGDPQALQRFNQLLRDPDTQASALVAASRAFAPRGGVNPEALARLASDSSNEALSSVARASLTSFAARDLNRSLREASVPQEVKNELARAVSFRAIEEAAQPRTLLQQTAAVVSRWARDKMGLPPSEGQAAIPWKEMNSETQRQVGDRALEALSSNNQNPDRTMRGLGIPEGEVSRIKERGKIYEAQAAVEQLRIGQYLSDRRATLSPAELDFLKEQDERFKNNPDADRLRGGIESVVKAEIQRRINQRAPQAEVQTLAQRFQAEEFAQSYNAERRMGDVVNAFNQKLSRGISESTIAKGLSQRGFTAEEIRDGYGMLLAGVVEGRASDPTKNGLANRTFVQLVESGKTPAQAQEILKKQGFQDPVIKKAQENFSDLVAKGELRDPTAPPNPLRETQRLIADLNESRISKGFALKTEDIQKLTELVTRPGGPSTKIPSAVKLQVEDLIRKHINISLLRNQKEGIDGVPSSLRQLAAEFGLGAHLERQRIALGIKGSPPPGDRSPDFKFPNRALSVAELEEKARVLEEKVRASPKSGLEEELKSLKLAIEYQKNNPDAPIYRITEADGKSVVFPNGKEGQVDKALLIQRPDGRLVEVIVEEKGKTVKTPRLGTKSNPKSEFEVREELDKTQLAKYASTGRKAVFALSGDKPQRSLEALEKVFGSADNARGLIYLMPRAEYEKFLASGEMSEAFSRFLDSDPKNRSPDSLPKLYQDEVRTQYATGTKPPPSADTLATNSRLLDTMFARLPTATSSAQRSPASSPKPAATPEAPRPPPAAEVARASEPSPLAREAGEIASKGYSGDWIKPLKNIAIRLVEQNKGSIKGSLEGSVAEAASRFLIEGIRTGKNKKQLIESIRRFVDESSQQAGVKADPSEGLAFQKAVASQLENIVSKSAAEEGKYLPRGVEASHPTLRPLYEKVFPQMLAEAAKTAAEALVPVRLSSEEISKTIEEKKLTARNFLSEEGSEIEGYRLSQLFPEFGNREVFIGNEWLGKSPFEDGYVLRIKGGSWGFVREFAGLPQGFKPSAAGQSSESKTGQSQTLVSKDGISVYYRGPDELEPYHLSGHLHHPPALKRELAESRGVLTPELKAKLGEWAFDMVANRIKNLSKATPGLNQLDLWPHDKNGKSGSGALRSLLRSDVAFFGPGHGAPGWSKHGIYPFEFFLGGGKEWLPIHIEIDLKKLSSVFASLPGVRASSAIFYKTCSGGVCGVSTEADAKTLARDTGKDVIAANGILWVRGSSLRSGKTTTLRVASTLNGPALPADEAFVRYSPDGSRRTVSFEEVKDLLKPELKDRLAYESPPPSLSSRLFSFVKRALGFSNPVDPKKLMADVPEGISPSRTSNTSELNRLYPDLPQLPKIIEAVAKARGIKPGDITESEVGTIARVERGIEAIQKARPGTSYEEARALIFDIGRLVSVGNRENQLTPKSGSKPESLDPVVSTVLRELGEGFFDLPYQERLKAAKAALTRLYNIDENTPYRELTSTSPRQIQEQGPLLPRLSEALANIHPIELGPTVYRSLSPKNNALDVNDPKSVADFVRTNFDRMLDPKDGRGYVHVGVSSDDVETFAKGVRATGNDRTPIIFTIEGNQSTQPRGFAVNGKGQVMAEGQVAHGKEGKPNLAVVPNDMGMTNLKDFEVDPSSITVRPDGVIAVRLVPKALQVAGHSPTEPTRRTASAPPPRSKPSIETLRDPKASGEEKFQAALDLINKGTGVDLLNGGRALDIPKDVMEYLTQRFIAEYESGALDTKPRGASPLAAGNIGHMKDHFDFVIKHAKALSGLVDLPSLRLAQAAHDIGKGVLDEGIAEYIKQRDAGAVKELGPFLRDYVLSHEIHSVARLPGIVAEVVRNQLKVDVDSEAGKALVAKYSAQIIEAIRNHNGVDATGDLKRKYPSLSDQELSQLKEAWWPKNYANFARALGLETTDYGGGGRTNMLAEVLNFIDRATLTSPSAPAKLLGQNLGMMPFGLSLARASLIEAAEGNVVTVKAQGDRLLQQAKTPEQKQAVRELIDAAQKMNESMLGMGRRIESMQDEAAKQGIPPKEGTLAFKRGDGTWVRIDGNDKQAGQLEVWDGKNFVPEPASASKISPVALLLRELEAPAANPASPRAPPPAAVVARTSEQPSPPSLSSRLFSLFSSAKRALGFSTPVDLKKATALAPEGISPKQPENLKVDISQSDLALRAEAATEAPKLSFIKDSPIYGYRITSDRFDDLPEVIRSALGTVDATRYTTEYLKENIGSVIALQMKDGKTPDFYIIGKDTLDSKYLEVPVSEARTKNAKLTTQLSGIPEVDKLLQGDSNVVAYLKTTPIEMIRLSDLGVAPKDEFTIESPWGAQTKPKGKDGFITKNEEGQWYLINIDGSGLPIAYRPTELDVKAAATKITQVADDLHRVWQDYNSYLSRFKPMNNSDGSPVRDIDSYMKEKGIPSEYRRAYRKTIQGTYEEDIKIIPNRFLAHSNAQENIEGAVSALRALSELSRATPESPDEVAKRFEAAAAKDHEEWWDRNKSWTGLSSIPRDFRFADIEKRYNGAVRLYRLAESQGLLSNPTIREGVENYLSRLAEEKFKPYQNLSLEEAHAKMYHSTGVRPAIASDHHVRAFFQGKLKAYDFGMPPAAQRQNEPAAVKLFLDQSFREINGVPTSQIQIRAPPVDPGSSARVYMLTKSDGEVVGVLKIQGAATGLDEIVSTMAVRGEFPQDGQFGPVKTLASGKLKGDDYFFIQEGAKGAEAESAFKGTASDRIQMVETVASALAKLHGKVETLSPEAKKQLAADLKALQGTGYYDVGALRDFIFQGRRDVLSLGIGDRNLTKAKATELHERLTKALSEYSRILEQTPENLGPALVHGDMHGGNLFITKEGEVTVIDFGGATYSLGIKGNTGDRANDVGRFAGNMLVEATRRGLDLKQEVIPLLQKFLADYKKEAGILSGSPHEAAFDSAIKVYLSRYVSVNAGDIAEKKFKPVAGDTKAQLRTRLYTNWLETMRALDESGPTASNPRGFASVELKTPKTAKTEVSALEAERAYQELTGRKPTEEEKTRIAAANKAASEKPPEYWGSKEQPFWRPGPNPTVDLVVTRDGDNGPEVLLIKRGPKGVEPNKWAIPGGFHDSEAEKGEFWRPGKESAEEAALRELVEETGLDASTVRKKMKKVGTYDNHERDPRDNQEAWAVTNAFRLHLDGDLRKASVRGMDDASKAEWVPIAELGKRDLAFDHATILRDATLEFAGSRNPEPSTQAPKSQRKDPGSSGAPSGLYSLGKRLINFIEGAFTRASRLTGKPGELPKAGPKADARFLVQERYDYDIGDSTFTKPMGEAIDVAVTRIQDLLTSGKPIVAKEVFEIMDGIAAVRKQIATAKNDPGQDLFGTPLFRVGDAPDPQRSSVEMQDYVSPKGRHKEYYDRATAVSQQTIAHLKAKKNIPQLEVFGQSFPKSFVARFGESITVFHPKAEKAAPLLQKAVEEWGKALSNPKLSESQFMNKMAEVYTALMHATPYMRGSPAIVESMLDASLRAKFGKTLGMKTAEPFWEVVLASPKRPVLTGAELKRFFGGKLPETTSSSVRDLASELQAPRPPPVTEVVSKPSPPVSPFEADKARTELAKKGVELTPQLEQALSRVHEMFPERGPGELTYSEKKAKLVAGKKALMEVGKVSEKVASDLTKELMRKGYLGNKKISDQAFKAIAEFQKLLDNGQTPEDALKLLTKSGFKTAEVEAVEDYYSKPSPSSDLARLSRELNEGKLTRDEARQLAKDRIEEAIRSEKILDSSDGARHPLQTKAEEFGLYEFATQRLTERRRVERALSAAQGENVKISSPDVQKLLSDLSGKTPDEIRASLIKQRIRSDELVQALSDFVGSDKPKTARPMATPDGVQIIDRTKGASQGTTPGPAGFVTFNVERFKNPSGVAEVLRQQHQAGAKVIALQEVKGLEALQDVLQRAGLSDKYSIQLAPGDQGLAVLTAPEIAINKKRTQMKKSEKHDGAVFLKTELSLGKSADGPEEKFTLFVVHTEAKSDPQSYANRQTQFADLVKEVGKEAKRSGGRVLVVGDMNVAGRDKKGKTPAISNAQELEGLEKVFSEAGLSRVDFESKAGTRPTISGREGKVFDLAFVGKGLEPEGGLKVVSGLGPQPPPGTPVFKKAPSDHAAIGGTFSVRGGQSDLSPARKPAALPKPSEVGSRDPEPSVQAPKSPRKDPTSSRGPPTGQDTLPKTQDERFEVTARAVREHLPGASAELIQKIQKLVEEKGHNNRSGVVKHHEATEQQLRARTQDLREGLKALKVNPETAKKITTAVIRGGAAGEAADRPRAGYQWGEFVVFSRGDGKEREGIITSYDRKRDAYRVVFVDGSNDPRDFLDREVRPSDLSRASSVGPTILRGSETQRLVPGESVVLVGKEEGQLAKVRFIRRDRNGDIVVGGESEEAVVRQSDLRAILRTPAAVEPGGVAEAPASERKPTASAKEVGPITVGAGKFEDFYHIYTDGMNRGYRMPFAGRDRSSDDPRIILKGGVISYQTGESDQIQYGRYFGSYGWGMVRIETSPGREIVLKESEIQTLRKGKSHTQLHGYTPEDTVALTNVEGKVFTGKILGYSEDGSQILFLRQGEQQERWLDLRRLKTHELVQKGWALSEGEMRALPDAAHPKITADPKKPAGRNPSTPELVNRHHEFPYSLPREAVAGTSKNPFRKEQFRTGETYLWVIREDGMMVIAPETSTSRSRKIKHRDLVPSPDGTQGQPARLGGEFQIVVDKSGRQVVRFKRDSSYVFARTDGIDLRPEIMRRSARSIGGSGGNFLESALPRLFTRLMPSEFLVEELSLDDPF